jgi:hypothetical protein
MSQSVNRKKDRLRSHLLHKDQDGTERYYSIPIDEFIHTEEPISPELLKRCHLN